MDPVFPGSDAPLNPKFTYGMDEQNNNSTGIPEPHDGLFGSISMVLHEFSRRTTFHGLRDACSAPTRKTKILWVLILFGVVSFLAYQITRLAIEYSENPTATEISLIHPQSFPRITYCSPEWVSETKLKSVRLDYLEFIYVNSILPVPGVLSLIAEQLSGSDIKRQTYNESILEIDKILNQYNYTIDDLLLQISHHERDIIVKPYASFAQALTTRVHTPSGICYDVHTRENIRAESRLPLVSFALKNNQLPFSIKDESTKGRYFYIGHNSLSMINGDAIHLTNNVDYQINIQATLIRQLSTKKHSCRAYNEQELANCVLNCINAHWRECHVYHPGGPNPRSISDLCSLIKDGWEAFKPIYGEIFSQCSSLDCPDSCSKWIYQTTTIQQNFNRKLRATNRSIFQFRLVNARSVFRVREYNSYSLNNLFANVGGSVSVLCGASVLSFVQLFCICCYHKGGSYWNHKKLWF